MGNKESQLSGFELEENAIEVTDRWSLNLASYTCSGGISKICVFISPVLPNNNGQNLLEKFAKNLMIYRHPSILRYVTLWQKHGKIYLATENVKPLAQVIPTQTALQICIGLQNILKALIFLHDKAQVSHNNVCRAAVYVNPEGTWKLGGLEYLCRFTELSSGYLNTTKPGRYDAGISANEKDKVPQPPSSIDCFAFGVLAEEVLSSYNTDDVPGLQEFKEICKIQLQNTSSAARPKLSSLLNLTFFTHEFINVHNFLTELPLKTDIEKQNFFRGLPHTLNHFDEEVVANQLSTLLLSRLVLLDTTAQEHLLPLIFVPRTNSDDDVASGRIFSEKTFKAHLVPKLLPMFYVRDAHVRLILLTHFSAFCSMFSTTHLKSVILPELLVGVKDTNDTLVSCTLRALADIVPILGSSVVIGGKSRCRLFADGRPKTVTTKTSTKINNSGSSKPVNSELPLPERASPDGGEALISPVYSASEEDTENWTDWENTAEDHLHNEEIDSENKLEETLLISNDEQNIDAKLSNDKPLLSNKNDTKISEVNNSTKSNSLYTNRKNSIPDLTELDIKNSKINITKISGNSKGEVGSSDLTGFKEIDYFQDMEPVITTNNKHVINVKPNIKNSISKYEFKDQESSLNDFQGWGDDDDDVNWLSDVNEAGDKCINNIVM